MSSSEQGVGSTGRDTSVELDIANIFSRRIYARVGSSVAKSLACNPRCVLALGVPI